MTVASTKNIYHHPGIRRTVEVNELSKQITIYDQRYYQRDAERFYPSVTFVLSYFPKNKFFESWAKDVGHNIDIILRKAGDEGRMVHKGIESMLNGKELIWLENSTYANYPPEVWIMLNRFTEFWETYKPQLISTECHLFSDEYEFAGTADIVCIINDEVWLIDIKTSNSIHKSFDLQTAAYSTAWNETHNTPVTRRGILWLKSPKRKPDRNGKKMQGDGWEILESKNNLEKDFKLFELAYELFKLENEEMKPLTEILPTSLKLNI